MERRMPTRSDVVVSAIALLVSAGTAWLASLPDGEDPFTFAAAAVMVAATIPLVIRREHPLVVWSVVGTLTAVYGVADWADPLVPVQVIVAVAAVVEVCRRRTVVAALAFTTVVAVTATALPTDSDALDWGVVVVTLATGASVGEFLRTRRIERLESAERAARHERDRARAVAEAQVAERRRIARELHDVVTHNVTMLVVQAEAAAGTPTMSDAVRVERFDALADNGRTALAELRQLLGVLRDPNDAAPSEPTANLSAIGELVERARGSGLDVDYRCTADGDPLPSAVELAAYRVVQEGLTNVVRHAGAQRATVTVEVDRRASLAAVTVDDDGRGGVAADGSGLTGLRERVSLLDGTLDAGPSADGFRLRATIPLGRS
jgi:signal transduction histidine kinase